MKRATHTLWVPDLEETQVLPFFETAAPGPEIRPDVVESVRFALASLPEQSRMLRARGLPISADIRANPVTL